MSDLTQASELLKPLDVEYDEITATVQRPPRRLLRPREALTRPMRRYRNGRVIRAPGTTQL